jgi:squalene-hopene/tetraprenyl-beta-curcumene cyclase
MSNSLMMYDALGYPPEHPDRVTARSAIEKLFVFGEDETYLQPCVSPVWDTALAAHALAETGDPRAEAAAADAIAWLKPRQVLDVAGTTLSRGRTFGPAAGLSSTGTRITRTRTIPPS